MAQFIRIGEYVLNVNQICEVVRVRDGSVYVALTNMHEGPPPKHAFFSRVVGKPGEVRLTGTQAARFWRYMVEEHAATNLCDTITDADRAVAAAAAAQEAEDESALAGQC